MKIKKTIKRIKDLRVVIVPKWYFDSSQSVLSLREGWHFQYLHYLKSGKPRWKRKAPNLTNDDEKEHLLIKSNGDAGDLIVAIFKRDEKGELSVANQMIIRGTSDEEKEVEE